MKKVIVTGANGFVGSALCRELVTRGVQVIALVKNQQSDINEINNLPGISIKYCEMSDYSSLGKLIPDRDVDALYHLAWIGSAGPLRGDIDAQIRNIQYSCDLVKACASIKCSRFIFSASIMEYEVSSAIESGVEVGINTLYCSAKLSADYFMRTIASNHGIYYIRSVISNIFGPGEISPRLINSSIRKMLKGERCSFSEGTQMYDFIYITDAVDSLIALGDKGKTNKTYYLGSMNPKPLREFLISMKNVIDPKLEIGLGDIPFTGVSLSYREFDIHAVQDDTGFAPKVSFEEGIRKTIAWIEKKEIEE